MSHNNDITTDPLLKSAPVVQCNDNDYKVLGGVVITAKLGQGGMGAVYKGRHLRLDVDVALKVMAPPSGLMATEADNYIKRFLREARTAAAVKHESLIRVYDVNVEEGVHYLIMDFVDGESANDRLKRKGRCSELEAVEIILGAARGLAEAHSSGIVHRDIKPDNILIDKKGGVVVADLGLAKAQGTQEADTDLSMNLSATQTAMGTPSFMSPEQTFSAKTVEASSDVWSLGVTLYQLVTGELPFKADDMVEMFMQIRNTEAANPRDVVSSLSDGLAEIINRCLKKNANERYNNAGELANVLEQHLETLKIDGAVNEDNELPSSVNTILATDTPSSKVSGGALDEVTLTLISNTLLEREGDNLKENKNTDALTQTTTEVVNKRSSGAGKLLFIIAMLLSVGGFYYFTNVVLPKKLAAQKLLDDKASHTKFISEANVAKTKGEMLIAAKLFEAASKLNIEGDATSKVESNNCYFEHYKLEGQKAAKLRDLKKAIPLYEKALSYKKDEKLSNILKGARLLQKAKARAETARALAIEAADKLAKGGDIEGAIKKLMSAPRNKDITRRINALKRQREP